MSEVTREDTPKHPAAAVAPKGQLSQAAQQDVAARRHTRSWDYVWRSGVAGGMAGCAVGTSLPFSVQPKQPY